MAAVPPDFQTSLVVGAGLDGPSGFDIAPDGRVFVLERTGKVKIVKGGRLLTTPFADLPSAASGDRGLIGVTFDPGFGESNHYVYFYYTGVDLLNHVVRFDASGDVGAAGPFQIFATQTPSELLHVGGSIAFGPDGKIYVAVGDNGQPSNAQDLSNPYGKILRLNSDGSVPSDNPFAGQPGKNGAIWAYGFRNPWRFQFDAATGRLYDGDVGDFSWEEINLIARGGNYGWPLAEGKCAANCTGLTDPVYAYPHDGHSAAITLGPIYRGTMFPGQYQGRLFFGDYARGFLKTAQLDTGGGVGSVADFDSAAGSVVDIRTARDGSLYYLNYYPGELYRVTYNTVSHAPVAQASANVTKGLAPLKVKFSSAGSSDPDGDPLQFLWDFGDGTNSSQANPAKNYSKRGVYTVRLTVSDGVLRSQARPIVIQVGMPPTLTISAPVDGMLYRAGDTITYNASAVDGAGSNLSDAAMSTEIRFHHGTHFHPFLGPLSGRTGTFTIPVTGEPSADTWYEIIVTATDQNGLTATKSVAIRPRTSRISLATSPSGLGLLLDGIPVTTPLTTEGVEGFHRELAAPPSIKAADGTIYHFTGWSDAQGVRHVITTPEPDTTYTATYSASAPFAGEYFANANLSGTPTLTRNDPSVDFLWHSDSPDPRVPADNFSVRWSKSEYLVAGRYKFTTVTDDGVRLFVDDRNLIDEWHDQSASVHEATVDLDSGLHAIRMEYFDSGWDAQAKLSWDSTSDQPGLFFAEYWNTPGAGASPALPTGPADLSRLETAIAHDWGLGSPGPEISADHFVARWTQDMALAAGTYEFKATTDDGVRLIVDGVTILDYWIDQGATTHAVTIALTGQTHTVAMLYYENGWDARAHLSVSRLG